MSVLDTITQGVDPIALLDKLVPRMTVRTAYGPDLVFERPFGPDDPNAQSPVAWLRPAIDIELATGRKTIAPYGDPGATQWPTVQLVAAGSALVLGGFIIAWAAGR